MRIATMTLVQLDCTNILRFFWDLHEEHSGENLKKKKKKKKEEDLKFLTLMI